MAVPVAPHNVQVIDYTKGDDQPQMQQISLAQLILAIVVLVFTVIATALNASESDVDLDVYDGFLMAGFLAAGLMGVICGGFGVAAFGSSGRSDMICTYFVTTVISCLFDLVAILTLIIYCALYLGDLMGEVADGHDDPNSHDGHNGHHDHTSHDDYSEHDSNDIPDDHTASQDPNNNDSEDDYEFSTPLLAVTWLGAIVVLIHTICTIISIHNMRQRSLNAQSITDSPVVYVHNPINPSVEIRPIIPGQPAMGYPPMAPSYPYPQEMVAPSAPAYPYPPPMPQPIYGL